VAALAPLLAEPVARAEQVTQLVLGESAAVLERQGEWRRVRTRADGYEAWVHRGYLRELADGQADEWIARANLWSEGAELDAGGALVRLPLRARVAAAGEELLLPDDRRARVVRGRVRAFDAVAAEALALPPEEWAARHFMGAPYQWGGVTPWGVDCSGMVQTTYAARGVAVPRDSAHQAEVGEPVPLHAVRPGDLLFFRGESGPRISHVAFAGADDTLVHATLACGGVLREPWGEGTRAAPLRARLVAARRWAPA